MAWYLRKLEEEEDKPFFSVAFSVKRKFISSTHQCPWWSSSSVLCPHFHSFHSGSPLLLCAFANDTSPYPKPCRVFLKHSIWHRLQLGWHNHAWWPYTQNPSSRGITHGICPWLTSNTFSLRSLLPPKEMVILLWGGVSCLLPVVSSAAFSRESWPDRNCKINIYWLIQGEHW